MSSTRRYLKAGHRKTRTGCFKCRARRVKCDEQKPVCTNCQRLSLACKFPEDSVKTSLLDHEPGGRTTEQSELPLTQPNSSGSSISGHDGNSPDTNETAPVPMEDLSFKSSRTPDKLRRVELHLLHAYMSRGMVSPGGIGGASEWRNAWFVELPRLALKHDNLLYALLAFSALQLHATSEHSAELSLAQSEFWSLALQEQRNMIVADDQDQQATTLAAYLICMIAFGMIRGRSLTPFTLPLAWFEVAQGALQVCPSEDTFVENASILHTTFQLTAPIRNAISQPVDDLYKPILTYRLEEEAQEYTGGYMMKEDIQAYEQVLGLITCFRHSVAEREPTYLHIRWICSFAQLVPSRFVTALRELRPRVLVILACFWAVLGNTESIVLAAFGDAKQDIPKNEMLAIRDNLPKPWHGLLQRSLDELSSADG